MGNDWGEMGGGHVPSCSYISMIFPFHLTYTEYASEYYIFSVFRGHNNWKIIILYVMPREKLLLGCIKMWILIYMQVKSCLKLNCALQMKSWEIMWRYLMWLLFKRRFWYSCVSEQLFRSGFCMGISRSRSVVSYTVWQDKSSLSHMHSKFVSQSSKITGMRGMVMCRKADQL